jgi:tetratricopeptide (TPR) repeat protein
MAMQFASDAGARRMAGEGPVNSEMRPILEYQAPKAFFMNSVASLPWQEDERLRLPTGGADGLLLGQPAMASSLRSADWQEIVAHREQTFGDRAAHHANRVFLQAWLRAEPQAERPRWEMIRWLRDEGRHEVALGMLEALLAQSPNRSEFLDVAVDTEFAVFTRRVGYLGIDEASYARMTSRLNRLRAMAPDHADDLDRRMAAIAFAAGHPEDGYASIDRIAAHAPAPERLPLWSMAAQAAMDGQDYPTAANYLRRALSQDANYGPALEIGMKLSQVAVRKKHPGQ